MYIYTRVHNTISSLNMARIVSRARSVSRSIERKDTSWTVASYRRRLLTAEAPLNEWRTGTIRPHTRCMCIRLACHKWVGSHPRVTVKESSRIRFIYL